MATSNNEDEIEANSSISLFIVEFHTSTKPINGLDGEGDEATIDFFRPKAM